MVSDKSQVRATGRFVCTGCAHVCLFSVSVCVCVGGSIDARSHTAYTVLLSLTRTLTHILYTHTHILYTHAHSLTYCAHTHTHIYIHGTSAGAVMALTRQPVKGRKKHGGIRLGEMERDALLSHGVAFCLHDRLMNSSDQHVVSTSLVVVINLSHSY